MFVVQQTTVGARVWTRVLTFASELEFVKGLQKRVEEPVAEMKVVEAPPEVPAVEGPVEISAMAAQEEKPTEVRRQAPMKRKKRTVPQGRRNTRSRKRRPTS